tara:strand:+ start:51 stop:293 length:243 start_codon:yes stop_codon:yes gene_type:complete
MSDSEFNENEQAKAKLQRRKAQSRPTGINPNVWKNRTLVNGKLTETNYINFLTWCKANNYNFNSGLNYLIHTHPDLNKDG